MTIKIAINGFGRIGRLVFRLASMNPNVHIVAINDLVPAENLAYLLKYDSAHRRFSKEIIVQDDCLVVESRKTKVYSEKDPENLPWKLLDVDFVVESTGFFTDSAMAKKHLLAGAKSVVISAPAKDQIPTFVMGVNHEQYNPKEHHIVSNASCTTNCLAPIAKVLLDHFGIEEGLMTTIHSLTASQPTVDAPSKKDFRGGRSAGQNIIPSTTGAAKAVGLCLPELKGKLTGMAFRVPTLDVSVVDLTVKLERSTTYEEICMAMKDAADGRMKGILAYCDEPVVSSDFMSTTYSSIFDKDAGIALNDRFYKIVSWYDNEMGYAARVLDLTMYMASKQ